LAALSFPKIIKLGAADLALLFDLDFFNPRRIDGPDSLNANTGGADAANSKGFALSPTLNCNHQTIKGMKPASATLDKANRNFDQVADGN
jgi:hypothetical protein